jgi:hypothetical protein
VVEEPDSGTSPGRAEFKLPCFHNNNHDHDSHQVLFTRSLAQTHSPHHIMERRVTFASPLDGILRSWDRFRKMSPVSP